MSEPIFTPTARLAWLDAVIHRSRQLKPAGVAVAVFLQRYAADQGTASPLVQYAALDSRFEMPALTTRRALRELEAEGLVQVTDASGQSFHATLTMPL